MGRCFAGGDVVLQVIGFTNFGFFLVLSLRLWWEVVAIFHKVSVSFVLCKSVQASLALPRWLTRATKSSLGAAPFLMVQSLIIWTHPINQCFHFFCCPGWSFEPFFFKNETCRVFLSIRTCFFLKRRSYEQQTTVGQPGKKNDSRKKIVGGGEAHRWVLISIFNFLFRPCYEKTGLCKKNWSEIYVRGLFKTSFNWGERRTHSKIFFLWPQQNNFSTLPPNLNLPSSELAASVFFLFFWKQNVLFLTKKMVFCQRGVCNFFLKLPKIDIDVLGLFMKFEFFSKLCKNIISELMKSFQLGNK